MVAAETSVAPIKGMRCELRVKEDMSLSHCIALSLS